MPPPRSRRRRSRPLPPGGRRPRVRPQSYRSPPDGQPADPDVPLAGTDRRRLARFAAVARLHLEVGPDGVDPGERLEAVTDQRGATTWLGDLAAFDQVALGDAEDEITGRRLDLPAPEGHGIEPAVHLADDRLRVRI